MLTISVLLLSAALLLALVLNLALKPAFSARLTRFGMLLALLGGLLYYGCGFAEATGDLALSVIRTPIAVIRMFVGVNELGTIAETRLVSSQAGLVLFWVLHLLAFCSTASAAMLTLGAALLRRLRLFLSRRGDLTLIYGIDERSLAFAQECRADGSGSVVLVAESASNDKISEINDLGMSVLSGRDAVESQPSALRALRLSGRNISVYAFDAEAEKNIAYALALRDALEKAKIPAERTRISLAGDEEILSAMLQVSPQRYGYGFVNAFDPAVLCARALIRLCPPWELLRFSEDGRAQDDFACAVVGFGRHGQAVLTQLVMNAQFAGSRFHAAVFSPAFEQESGAMAVDCPELFRHYDIESFPVDGRSRVFYDYLCSHLSSLRLIAVCTGSERMNTEIADNLMLFLSRRGAEDIRVVQCGAAGVRLQRRIGGEIEKLEVFQRAFLSAEEADRRAILLNAVYDDSERSDWEKWVACDSFSKMSSRASADFAPAFLALSHSSADAISEGDWKPGPALLETLGETEHLRWCAFHYANGYAPMDRECFEARAAASQQSADAGGLSVPRPAKDTIKRLHACLVPWDELRDLSACERKLTGRSVDYQQIDINNVLALPKLLAAERSGGGK